MKYYRFDLKLITMNILSIFMFIIPIFIYLMVKSLLGIDININQYTFWLIILMFFVHELLHGIGFSLFVKDKSKIKYGILLEKGVFYAMCQDYINKKGMIVSLLFPTIFLTFILFPIAIIVNSDTLAMIAIFNFAGAVGDLTMLNLIRKLPNDIKYIDYDLVVGCTFISKDDLSKYKSFGIKFVESGKDDKKLINNNIKKFTCSKFSLMIIIILLVIGILNLIF